MNLVRRNESQIVIRQIPFLLLGVTALFSLPFLAFSLFHLLGGTDADGIFFCLFMGLFLLWVFLEFVATRERIAIDLEPQVLTRSVRGVFRTQEQVIDLREVQSISLEIKRDVRGRRRQYLYLNGSKEKFLINSPSKLYLNHDKLGRLLNEATRIPYQAPS